MIFDELKIAFVHVAKTGGRSVSRLLHENLERRHEVNNPHTALKKADNDYLCSLNLIEGHCGYQIVDLPRCFKYITILRNPVERVLSSYNHLMKSGDDENKMGIAVRMRKEKWSFVDYVTSKEHTIMYWVHHPTFLISGVNAAHDGMDVRRLLPPAIKNLRYNFDFVGIFERLEDTVNIMKRKYGLVGDMPHVGRNDSRHPDKYTPTKDELEIAHDELFCDWVLYRLAEKRFNEAYHALA